MKPQNNVISYGFASSPFGDFFVAWFDEKICQLWFTSNVEFDFEMFQNKYTGNNFQQNNEKAQEYAELIFVKNLRPELYFEGTDFQKRIWKALCEIPVGTTTTYSQIAQKAGNPKAVRAAGTAIGANPIAYLIPCHRIIRTDGNLGGFRWGLEVKKKMLKFEGL